MPAPIAKGLIILSSVLVAAGFALYQDPVVREWVDRSRRKIAIALHSLGDEIDSPSRSSPHNSRGWRDTPREDEASRRRRRDEIVRRNRNELIRKAREEGVAVDLDELAAIGRDNEDEAVARAQRRREEEDRSDKSKSFDQLVGHDGTLRADTTAAEASTANDDGLRHRGAAARGFSDGSAFANPFAEDEVLFDREVLENADQPTEGVKAPSQASEQESLIDIDPRPVSEMTMVNDSVIPASMSASFHSALSSPSTMSHHSFIADDNDAPTPTGTLTPVEDGFSTAASVIGSNADDIGAIDLLSDAGASEISGFSNISGTHTPSSWTDVESDVDMDEDEHQHQQQQQ